MYDYRPTKEEVKMCLDFAERLIKETKYLYTLRNPQTLKKILNDQVIGKLGEIASYEFLKSKGIITSYPDFNVYKDRSLISFDADLKNEEYNFHCKSQSIEQAWKFGLSWTFQYDDKYKTGKDSLILRSNDNDILIVSVVNMKKNIVRVYGAMKCNILNKYNLFKDPISERLKGVKKVAYYVDLKKYLKGI